MGDEGAIDRAKGGAGEATSNGDQREREPGLREETCRYAADREYRSDGDIDLAREDDERRAKGDDQDRQSRERCRGGSRVNRTRDSRRAGSGRAPLSRARPMPPFRAGRSFTRTHAQPLRRPATHSARARALRTESLPREAAPSGSSRRA